MGRPKTVYKEKPFQQDNLNNEKAALAFEKIVQEYTIPLMRFICSRVRCSADAEDICQETFLKAFRSRDSFDGQSSLKTWLFSIAYHETVSFLRKKKIPTTGSFQSLSVENASSDLQNPDSENIWHWARELPAEQYTLLWLKYKEDLSTEQIAQILRKSRLNTRVMLHRARRRLAEILRRKETGRDFAVLYPNSKGFAYAEKE
ncbi:MAG TPA: sigma-70 family RNA polymerase sigma factor [Anaerohalosphaeraceae bacterium]|nr:sigma-70 family RNA polymerase sigma factor [Anaerohalosphaeraceae bacterium]